MLKTVVRVGVGLVVFPIAVAAQVFTVGGGDEGLGPRRSPVFGSVALVYSQPTGDFGRIVHGGFGVDGYGRWKVDRRGIFSVGVEGGFMQYGRETIRSPLSTTVGRITVDVVTANNIASGAIGPQLTAPSGPVRPYVSAGIGLSYMYTQSSVQGADDYSYDEYSFAETTNFSDVVATKTAGLGVLIPFRRRDMGLDLGIRYNDGGRGRYLVPGSIEDLPGGGTRITPEESVTRMWTWRIGFAGGLR